MGRGLGGISEKKFYKGNYAFQFIITVNLNKY